MINNETHTRFWVTLPKPYFDLLARDAKDLNLSATAYAGQILTQHIQERHNDVVVANDEHSLRSPESLNEIIVASLEKKEYGVAFTVKDLFDEATWGLMSRSEKAISAKILASIERNTDTLEIVDRQNKTALYARRELK